MFDDPWKHRIGGMRCKTCMWFAPKTMDMDRPEHPKETSELGNKMHPINMGRCRRHAPTMNGYPVVFVNDWCGDHKLDENKL